MAKELSEKKKRMILAGIVCFTVLYADLNYILKGQTKNLREVTFKLNNVRSDVYQYKRHFSKLKSMREELSALNERNKGLNSMVFSESDIASFLDDISQKANSRGIKIMNIQPQEKKGQAKNVSLKSGSGFYPLPFKLELNAGYHQLGGFISDMEANPFITASGLSISSSVNSAKHKVSLILNAYVKK